jgi:hypothetical protein
MAEQKTQLYPTGNSHTTLEFPNHWKVLDVGSGHNPHKRANVLVDRFILNNFERSGQKIDMPEDKLLIQADGAALPFPSKIFDFVICSHVVEHIPIDELEAFCEEHKEMPYSVAWIDCLAKGNEMGRALLMLGEFRNDGALDYQNKEKFTIPFHFPSFTLNTLSVKVFNCLYYRRVKEKISKQKVDIDTFFYPLDAINHWNRIYGKKGFTQYQFVLPKEKSYEENI